MTTYKDTPTGDTIYPNEYEQASNSYLMAVATLIAGLPLPIINVLAAVGYYLAHRKSAYFVRWHCMQAIIAQAIMVPFNGIALAWTLSVILRKNMVFPDWEYHNHFEGLPDGIFEGVSIYYFLYIFTVLFLNLIEFFTVVYTAGQVRKGHNVRWFLIATVADGLTSKKNRDPYRI